MIRRTVTAVLATFLVALIPLTAQAQSVPTDGLQLWLRADAVEAADDAKVTMWTDRGPQGRALSQRDADRRPTYVADAINGQPLLKFDDNDGFNVPSLLTAGSGYTILRVTRQKDRGYVSVAEGTISEDEAGSTVQRFLQGQVAEVLIYDRRLSETEKKTVSEALGQRYNLGPGATAARSDNATGETKEGVRVHGAWTITVRNPDGSLDTRRQIENSMVGTEQLVNVMSHNAVIGVWEVRAEDLSQQNPPCELSDGSDASCTIIEPDFTGSGPSIFKNLSVARINTDDDDTNDAIELTGTFTAQNTGGVNDVSTDFKVCNDTSKTIDQCLTEGDGEPGRFTLKTLSNRISIDENQQVSMTVVISFQ